MINDNKPLIILGSGGHAGVLIEILSHYKFEVLGLVDPNKRVGEKVFGLEVIAGDVMEEDFSTDSILLINGIGSLPDNQKRMNIAKDMRSRGFEFASVIHPSATLSKSCSISEGAQVMAGSVIQHNVSIGIDTIINTGTLIDHECKIGNNCHAAPGSVLSGNVNIGDKVHIGTGSTIIQGITIGEGCIVAPGSVVYKDLDPYKKFIQILKER